MVNSKLRQFWRGKKVFITGHTGFKGSWLAILLESMGAEVTGYSLPPTAKPNLHDLVIDNLNVTNIYGDILDIEHLNSSISNFCPDVLFHMAAQPLVRRSYEDPIETFNTNITGTVNVLHCSLKCEGLKTVINVTTDKCYKNIERHSGYFEDDPLGGDDPYSSSKACSEIVTAAYRKSFFSQQKKGLASARAGNVIGGGDWAQDRLIPDIFRSFENKEAVLIRYPDAVRPWQHVLEPLFGYMMLAKELHDDADNFAGAWNFGPNEQDAQTVKWILNKMSAKMPGFRWEIDNRETSHEATLLRLNIGKSQSMLGWSPIWDLEKSLEMIINWHTRFLSGDSPLQLCLSDIREFENDIK